MAMKRRKFLLNAGIAAASGALSACGKETPPDGISATGGETKREWKLVTSWPPNFPGFAQGAVALGEAITKSSGGRLTVSVHAGGELVPPFEVFDAVARGTAQMGHSAAYYWQGKSAAAPFFCAVPFGLNAQEMNAWLYRGGGLELWRELYAKFDLVPFPAGNTGVQLAGWFNREISAVSDVKGLKIRLPGLGGAVMARLGAIPVSLPATDIFSAMQSGAIDAAEWVGPYNDLDFGLFRVAKYCYYPGWQEPGPVLECLVNKTAYEALPDDLKAVVANCCQALNDDLLATYTAENSRALKTLVAEHGVKLRQLPDSVLAALRKAADAELEALVAQDAFARRVYDSFKAFRDQVRAWHAVSEAPYYQAGS